MREPIPDMNLPPIDPRVLSDRELKLLTFDRLKLCCSVEGCKKYTWVRDYGIFPVVQCGPGDWPDLSNRIYFCRGHHQMYKANPNIPLKPGPGSDQIIRL